MSRTARNDVTGDKIQSRLPSKQFRDNFENIQFGVNKPGDGLASTQCKAERKR